MLILRFHPIRRGLGACLNSLVSEWCRGSTGLVQEIGMAPVIQIAYGKAGCPLQVAASRACGA